MIYFHTIYYILKGEKFRKSLIERYLGCRSSWRGEGNETLTKKEFLEIVEQKKLKLNDMQCRFDSLGASDLVIDMLMRNDNLCEKLFKEAVLLGIALLEGGNSQVQVNQFIFILPLYFFKI